MFQNRGFKMFIMLELVLGVLSTIVKLRKPQVILLAWDHSCFLFFGVPCGEFCVSHLQSYNIML